jgi:hypothetical protein
MICAALFIYVTYGICFFIFFFTLHSTYITIVRTFDLSNSNMIEFKYKPTTFKIFSHRNSYLTKTSVYFGLDIEVQFFLKDTTLIFLIVSNNKIFLY